MKLFVNTFFSRLDYFIRTPSLRYSLISVAVIITVSTILMFLNVLGTTYQYSIGDIAMEDIRVPRDIRYTNEVETGMKKKRASESVPLVFDRDSQVLIEKLKITGILFNHVKHTLDNNPPIGTDDLTFQLIALKSRLPKYLLYNDRILTGLLRYGDPDALKKIVFKIFIYIFDDSTMGILDKPYDNPMKINNKNIVVRVVNTPEQLVEESRSLEDLKTLEEVRQKTYSITHSLYPNLPASTLYSVTQIVRSNLKPNLVFNLDETRRRINEKQKEIKPVTGLLKKGQTLVREGDAITMDIRDRIEILNRHTESSHVTFILGIFFIQVIFLMILGYLIPEYNAVLIPGNRSSIIVGSLILIFMVYTFFIASSETMDESKLTFALLLPIPFVTMIVSVLFNIYLAMVAGLYLVFFTAVIGGGDIYTTILAFSSALVGVFVNVNAIRRTDFLRGGLMLGLINSLIIVAITLMNEMPFGNMMRNVQLSFANGLVNSILALGILPIYEQFFGITTRFRLMELSDLNADIFKQMLVNAPGTYNHSLLVSTMAEAACKEIGGNHMLARVGGYYHDIGKINDAGLYIENRITDPRSKKLTSMEYSQLIISHVNKGIELAKKNGLPESVIDFIAEHHGRSTMTYFYHQALEEANTSEEHERVERKNFQYPGPRPHSRETAIVMLADSVEAASRSLQEPTQIQLEGLVRKIVYNKLNEGELEYSDLSMIDLNIIQKSFLRILNGIFHTRLEYPEEDAVTTLEKKLSQADDQD